MTLFRPPKKLPDDTPAGLGAVLAKAFVELYGDLKALTASFGDSSVAITSYRATAGETKRVSPPATGMGFVLPAPAPENRGSTISVFIENPEGSLRVFVAPNSTNDATVNGQEMVSFDTEGLVVFESNGVNRWSSPESFSSAAPATVALDAEYVLGATSASLPNGRVATDTTEIDAVLTTPLLISWALKTASVAFSKLVNLAGLSVLGRASNSSGVMAAITATAASQTLQSSSDGLTIGWAGIEPTDFNVTESTTLTNYVLPTGMRPGDTLAVTLTGNVILNSIVPPLGVSRNFWFFLCLRDQNGGDFTLSIPDVGTFSGSGRAFRTPGQDFPGGTAYTYVMQSEEEGCVITYSGFTGVEIWRVVAGTAAQAVTGDVVIPTGKGGSRVAAIGTGVIVNADVNASAALALSKLATQAADTLLGNFTNGTAVPTARAGTLIAGNGLTYTTGGTMAVGVVSSLIAGANDVQRAALTGDVTAAQDSNATTLASGVVTPAKLAVESSNIGAMFVIHVTATAGTPGSADDVTVYNANAPFAFRILDALWLDSTAIALSTVQLRDTAGGGGAALSSALTAAVTGTARNNDSQTRTVAANGSVFLRRSDRGVAGEIVILAVRT